MNAVGLSVTMILFAIVFGYLATLAFDWYGERIARRRKVSVLNQYLLGRSIVRMK